MNWTRDMPVVGGWYWVKKPGCMGSYLVWVRADLKYLYSTDFAGFEPATALDVYDDVEWAGPLAPPQ